MDTGRSGLGGGNVDHHNGNVTHNGNRNGHEENKAGAGDDGDGSGERNKDLSRSPGAPAAVRGVEG